MSEGNTPRPYDGTAYSHRFAKMAIGAVVCFAIGALIDKTYDVGMAKRYQKKANS